MLLADGLVCKPLADANPSTEVNIVEDFIVDESSTQKIIRVNPVDLPAVKPQENGNESELYNIQNISPAYKRKYTLSNSIRKKNDGGGGATASNDKKNKEIYLMKKPPTSKHRNNLKRLKFSYNINHTIDGTDIPISRLTRVHIAPGAYPVFYGIAKVNGRFVKNSIKSFSNEEQLIKNLIKIDLAQQKVDDGDAGERERRGRTTIRQRK